jgi:hypothetical protein
MTRYPAWLTVINLIGFRRSQLYKELAIHAEQPKLASQGTRLAIRVLLLRDSIVTRLPSLSCLFRG